MMATGRLLLALFCLSGSTAWPQPPDGALAQLNHRVFTAAEGAPSEISALAQTSDGTLWIGGRTGLARFDGARFVRYPGPSDEPLDGTNVASLLATPDGGLWIGFRPVGVSLLKNSRVTRFGTHDGLPFGTVQQLALDRDGSIWAASRLGLARFDGERWYPVVDHPALATPYGVLVDGAGTLWAATLDGLFARPAGDNRFHLVDSRAYSQPAGVLLAAAPGGGIWAAADEELVNADWVAGAAWNGGVAVSGVSGGPLLFDADGALWAAGGDDRDLFRVPARDLVLDGDPRLAVDPAAFARSDGLRAGRVFALLEDRERNIWVGTNAGLHRFSRGNVVSGGAPSCVQYEFEAGVVVAGNAGSLWIACTDPEPYVAELRDGAVVRRQSAPPLTVAHRDTEGTAWFAGPEVLARIENDRLVTEPLPELVRGRAVQALFRERGGAMWLSVTRRGTFRVENGTWVENAGLEGLPRGEFAYAITGDEDGVMWLGYTENRVARVHDGVVQMFDRAQGLDVGNVLAVLALGGETWVGGELGFARFDGERFVAVRSAAGEAFKGASGIVKARNGDLWLNTSDGIVHVFAHELDRVLEYPEHRVESESFDHLDGVPGPAVQLRPAPSAIETTDGKLWFATTGGIASIDATQLVRNTLPPPVTIWSLTAGGRRIPSFGQELRLPVHTRDLQIDYSAGSLTVPERVRFRYKLDGLDREWQDVGSRREARYTNLAPGRYTFRVTASNNDGVWNGEGAALTFAIAPALYQTGWFYALCGFACFAALTGLYRARIRQVAAQARGRLEARLSERERIARDLHDTLLQGVQGLIWRFQAAADSLPPGEPARRELEQSLDRADQLLAESRDKVKDLRPAARHLPDLAQALAAEGEQLGQRHSAAFRVSVQGASRALHPLVREEGFLIGREALANAFRHARADDIEAEVTYDANALHVRIRDDGQGISSGVLDAGKPGHFGLVGMRERARKIGAHLEVWSRPGAGTEVDLRVPASVAYQR